MLGAVIGNGPRTGTSFVMGKLHEAGLPVKWDETINVPGAEYDMCPSDIIYVRSGVLKVWPHLLSGMRSFIDRAVILHRDRDSQKVSIQQQIAREVEAGFVPLDKYPTPGSVIRIHDAALNKWLAGNQATEILHIDLPALDARIDEIVAWFSAMFAKKVA